MACRDVGATGRHPNYVEMLGQESHMILILAPTIIVAVEGLCIAPKREPSQAQNHAGFTQPPQYVADKW